MFTISRVALKLLYPRLNYKFKLGIKLHIDVDFIIYIETKYRCRFIIYI